MLKSHRRRGCRELKSEINIVPLLDVLLVLLLIFIVMTSIVTQSVEVSLPESTDFQMSNINNNSSVVIEVPSIGRYSVVEENNRIDQLSSKQVVAEVKRHLNINPKTVFLIGGAKDVPYDEIIKTLNLLHNSGVKSVGLMTQPI